MFRFAHPGLLYLLIVILLLVVFYVVMVGKKKESDCGVWKSGTVETFDAFAFF